MGIKVKFGEYSCENTELDKSDWLTWYNQGNYVDCQLVNTDILEPVLKVSASYANATYVEIQDFNRFYFVSNPESISGTHCLLHCHVDVLHTYRNGISNMECLIMRNEDINKWKRDLTDRVIPASNKRVTFGKNIGDDMVNGGTLQYFLIGVI